MPSGIEGRIARERAGFEQPGAAHLAAAGGPGFASLDQTAPDSGSLGEPFDDSLVRGLVDSTALLAGLLLAGCGLVLAARRLAGAMAAAPGPALILAVCAAAFALLAVADRGSRRGAARMAGTLARFGLLTMVAAVALPLRLASPAAAVAAIAAVGVSLVALGRGPGAALARTVVQRITAARAPASIARFPAADGMEPLPATAPLPPLDGNLLQRFERVTLPHGVECVRGRVRVSIAAGSRLGVAHVGFCPPLAATPTVDVTTDYDGVEAVVSAAEVLPWGVRVECRLDEPAEEMVDIPVDLQATASA